MRAASRPSFPAQRESESHGVLLVQATVTLAFLALVLGTIGWLTGLLLVENDLLNRSLPWWSFVRFAALFHLLRALLVVEFKR